jgi:hypothetical protein
MGPLPSFAELPRSCYRGNQGTERAASDASLALLFLTKHGVCIERVAADEPHGVVGAAVGVCSQAVHPHDVGMLQPAGDLGIEQEPLAAGRVVGVVVQDLFERDFAVELGIECHKDRAQTAAGVRPQHPEPLALEGRWGGNWCQGWELVSVHLPGGNWCQFIYRSQN